MSDIRNSGESSFFHTHSDHPIKPSKNLSDHSLEYLPRMSVSSADTHRTDLQPFSRLEAPLCLSLASIKESFTEVARKHRFYVSEESSNQMLVTYRNKLSLLGLLRCCISEEDSDYDTKASLQVKINEKSCVRELHLRGVCGNPFASSAMIESFASKLVVLSSQSQPAKYHQLDEEEDFIFTCKQEASSYYEFCKILSSEAYSLGKSVSEFVASFTSQYRNPNESAELLPQPTESLKNKVEEIVLALFSEYNYGKASAEKIMMFCRPAVEKFLFSKLATALMEAYKAKYAQLDAAFLTKRQTGGDWFEAFHIKIRAKYELAIEQVNRLQSLSAPAEKMNCLLSAIADAKSEVLDFTAGKAELSVFEESAVIAYVLLKSTGSCFYAELAMLSDWDSEGENNVLSIFTEALKLVHSL